MITFLLGIVTGLAATMCWEGLRRMTTELRRRSVPRFWDFLHKEVAIIHPVYRGPGGNKMPPNMARVEDVIAIHLITTFLRKSKVKYRLYGDDEPIPHDVDVVLVCSPKGSKRSDQFQERSTLPVRFDWSKQGRTNSCFRDVMRNEKYYSDFDLDKKKKIDLALVGRCTEEAPMRRVFLIWGIHGVGTLGAAHYSVDGGEIRETMRRVGDSGFARLIKAHYTTEREVTKATHLAPLWIIDHP